MPAMQNFVLHVWGDFACFSQLKVERFSYPVITPSAARGIFDAIFCKSVEFCWRITKVEVLAPINYISLRRNEVKDGVQSEKKIINWMQGKERPDVIIADGTEEKDKGRTQRQTMALKNVNYLLHAEVRPWQGFEERLAALEQQFYQRASRGKCFLQPCFGCREFPAFFELIENGEKPKPYSFDKEIGLILYDVFDLSRPGTSEDEPFISLFRANIVGGVMEVPEYESEAVLKPERKEVK